MSKFAEADQLVFDYFSQIEEDLTETKQMLEEVVTLVYSYLSLPQHTDSPPNAFYQNVQIGAQSHNLPFLQAKGSESSGDTRQRA